MGTKGLRYAVRDGFSNLGRHPLVLLASVTTMFLMLLIMGLYTVFAMNVVHLLEVASQQPAVEIQFMVGAAEADVRSLDRQFADNSLILEHKVYSPEENFEDLKQRIGKAELFADFDFRDKIPWTIRVRLEDPDLAPTLSTECLSYPGVEDVQMAKAWMTFLKGMMQKAFVGSMTIFFFLSLIAIFIISNMIRVAALSRKSELGIMKYLGATDFYISVPYVIEGLVVGFLAAFFASLSITLLYRVIYDAFSGGSMYRLLSMRQTLPFVFLFNSFVGLIMGGVTSAVALRKYIKV